MAIRSKHKQRLTGDHAKTCTQPNRWTVWMIIAVATVAYGCTADNKFDDYLLVGAREAPIGYIHIAVKHDSTFVYSTSRTTTYHGELSYYRDTLYFKFFGKDAPCMDIGYIKNRTLYLNDESCSNLISIYYANAFGQTFTNTN